jgi:hypothetical protein
VGVKHGLNRQQKSVKQMPALFKPRDISPVLTAPKDPEHPAHGMLVGASESQGMASEEMLGRKKSLADYLGDIESRHQDRDLARAAADRELGQRAKPRDFVVRATMEDPTQSNPVIQQPSPVLDSPTYAAEGQCVRSMTMEDGTVMEIHGDDHSGYGVRCGTRGLPTRFESMSDAEMACEMYMARSRRMQQAQDLSQDYIEEA